MATETLNPNPMALASAGANEANAPATSSANAPAATGSRMPSWLQAKDGPAALVADVLRQPSVRKALPFIVIFMLLVSVAVFFTSLKPTPYRPLVMMLSDTDKQAAVEALKAADFRPEIDQASGQISVPTARFQEARMLLASKGLPRAEASGMDNLKDMPAMTTSQFMEQVRYNNAMEQELARTIEQIAGIRKARVHLAAPKQSVFVRDRAPTKASVIITRQPGRTVAPSNVQAIIQLVASSVPYLAPENVSVVDNYGSLMNDMLTEQPLGLTAQQLTQKQQMEDLYRQRLIQLLAPIVGEANVTAQVSMTLDFTQTEITTEDFDAQDKGPKTRSELFVEDRNTFRDAVGIPGSLANTPPEPVNPQATTQTNADPLKGVSEKGVQVTARSTKNYELDRSVRHTKAAMGNITRLGVGVLLNERPIPAGMKVEKPADGAPPQTSIPYSQEELDRLNQLVKGAVGFNENRGDVVTVVATKFEPQVDPNAVPWYLDENYQSLVNAGVIGSIFLFVLLGVVRPLVKRLVKPPVDPAAIAAAATEAANQEAKMAIEVATAESVAAQNSARALREAHEKEMARISEEARRAAEAAARLAEGVRTGDSAGQEVQVEEGESLEDVKARMASLKPKKQTIPADLLNTANSYDDKVALIRMIVAEDSTRVAGVLKSLIRPDA